MYFFGFPQTDAATLKAVVFPIEDVGEVYIYDNILQILHNAGRCKIIVMKNAHCLIEQSAVVLRLRSIAGDTFPRRFFFQIIFDISAFVLFGISHKSDG